MTLSDGGQQHNNQPTKGSAKAGGGGCGDRDKDTTATVMDRNGRCNWYMTGMTATQGHDGNAMVTVMNGDGQCNGNATATTAMEGTMETQRQR